MKNQHVCPLWLGFVLINPFRRFVHNPIKILGPYLKSGMKAVDFGCAMGYFSLPMASMVGITGKVYCFDIQREMLNKLLKRAENKNLDKIIEPRLITDEKAYEGINHSIHFALLFAVAHEVPNQKVLFKKLSELLKTEAILLFAEPKGHVKKN
jgi:2-polyprenyl-3-methyl-5-hydroxy-6-metoxy-1,4-benzoquinol methylase